MEALIDPVRDPPWRKFELEEYSIVEDR